MEITQTVLALLLVMFSAGCADDMPVTSTYVPADCPPVHATTSSLDVDEPEEVDVVDEEVDAVDDHDHDADDDEVGDNTGEDAILVDLNSASQPQLIALPGVGPALAGRIIEYREKRRFERVEDLQRVRGIGSAKYAKLRPLVSVGAARQKRKL